MQGVIVVAFSFYKIQYRVVKINNLFHLAAKLLVTTERILRRSSYLNISLNFLVRLFRCQGKDKTELCTVVCGVLPTDITTSVLSRSSTSDLTFNQTQKSKMAVFVLTAVRTSNPTQKSVVLFVENV
jgi:hypothetical protein